MPLFLVSKVYDEGLYPDDLRLVEAADMTAVAQSMLDHPATWKTLLGYARPVIWSHGDHGVVVGHTDKTLWDYISDSETTADQLLTLISRTHVDGDSYAQVRITPLAVATLP